MKRSVEQMYKICKSEQSARRQQQLEEGLLQLMGECEYDSISVSDLCSRLQVPRKSFYRYFSGKDGALHALIDHTLLRYEEFTLFRSSDERRSLQRELTGFFRFWQEQKPFLDALSHSHMDGILVERSIRHALSASGIPSRFLPPDNPELRRQTVLFFVSGLMHMILFWHRSGYHPPAELMAVMAVQLIGHPLFPVQDIDR